VLSDREAIEVFHLSFVRVLFSGPDKSSFAIKGGCNLRFYFGSIRYSEDIDFDVQQRVPVHTLKSKVEGILTGTALTLSLKSSGLRISRWSAPKQTETTQRWKAALAVSGKTNELNTKIEFSRRPALEEARIEAVDPAIVQHYRLMPTVATHYPVAAALRQKVLALIGRREVQVRDLFDLSVLLARSGGDVSGLASMSKEVKQAIERAADLTYDQYVAQVVAYLTAENAESYSSREAWEAMQGQVVDALQRVLP
jgi:predicted nucleotidyltransferase component of viral defense system